MAIYRDEPSRRRECLYYLALGHYQLGNYEEARKFNGLFLINVVSVNVDVEIDMLMDKEPHNMQAQALGGLIQKAVSKGAFGGACALWSSGQCLKCTEGLVGMALVGSLAYVQPLEQTSRVKLTFLAEPWVLQRL